MAVVIVKLVVLCWYIGIVGGTEFVMSPQSVNATLNSTVTFTCQATGFSGFVWRINNTLTPSSSASGDMAELEVFCSEDRDMSLVECGGILPNRSAIFTDPALLRIQGLLGPVINLSVHSTPTSIILMWVPPPSLDITGVEPDFTHTVEVYTNTSDGGRQEVSVYENITGSTFTFTLCGLCCWNQSCVTNPSGSVFEFIVTAVNVVGRGEPSAPVQGGFMEDPIESTTDSVGTHATTIATTTTTTDDDDTMVRTSTEAQPVMLTVTNTVVISLVTTVVGGIFGSIITLVIVMIPVIRVKRQSKLLQESRSAVNSDQGPGGGGGEIEMKRCDAYDVVSKQCKKGKTKNKPPPPTVYEEVDL